MTDTISTQIVAPLTVKIDKAHDEVILQDATGFYIASMVGGGARLDAARVPMAERIAACVNACAGISDSDLANRTAFIRSVCLAKGSA